VQTCKSKTTKQRDVTRVLPAAARVDAIHGTTSSFAFFCCFLSFFTSAVPLTAQSALLSALSLSLNYFCSIATLGAHHI
jgi:hypothetical protein